MASVTQRMCPKCFKLNNGANSVCDGCGADISSVAANSAQGRRSIFGYVSTGTEEPVVNTQTSRAIHREPARKQADRKKADVYTFAAVHAPKTPW